MGNNFYLTEQKDLAEIKNRLNKNVSAKVLIGNYTNSQRFIKIFKYIIFKLNIKGFL